MTNIPQRQPWQLRLGGLSSKAVDEIVKACELIAPERAWSQC